GNVGNVPAPAGRAGNAVPPETSRWTKRRLPYRGVDHVRLHTSAGAERRMLWGGEIKARTAPAPASEPVSASQRIQHNRIGWNDARMSPPPPLVRATRKECTTITADTRRRASAHIPRERGSKEMAAEKTRGRGTISPQCQTKEKKSSHYRCADCISVAEPQKSGDDNAARKSPLIGDWEFVYSLPIGGR